MSRGRIFDVKEFSVHDGPGARITFFLKGCPLRCLWCHNPEGQSCDPELMVRSALCKGCGACFRASESDLFLRYGRDPAACPNGLITLCGDDVSAEDLVERVLPLNGFLLSMGGGVTFSGGEPLMQPSFLQTCLERFRSLGIHTAVETCGYAPESVFRDVISTADYILMDLKILDPQRHLAATGVDNASILRNAEILMQSQTPFVFRTPLIPGHTDSPENLDQIRGFIGNAPWETLPYNELAGAKYPMLNRNYPLDVRKGE